MRKLLGLVAFVVVVLAGSTPALANNYITTSTDDWLRYRNQRSGQEVTAEIDLTSGNWRMWTELAGMGPTWVWTFNDNDWLVLWNGSTYQFVANLSGAVGSSRQVVLPGCQSGTVTVARKGSLAVAAGSFSDTVTITFSGGPCADAGTTSITFARGVGIVKWTEDSFIGEQSWELQAALVGGRNLPAANPTPTPTPTPTPSTGPVAATEHAQLESILWGANDTYLVIDNYVDSFTGLSGSGVRSDVIVDSDATAAQLRYELGQAGVPMADVRLLLAAVDSIWMRDYGPIVMKRGDGTRVVADLRYYTGRPNDDVIPEAWAAYRGFSRVAVNISYEGGNFATDGRGRAFSSLGVLRHNPSKTQAQVEAEFAKMGCPRVTYFEPLIDEGTTHIDMFARIMSDTHALVSRYPSSSRQARVVDAAARTLEAAGYTVVRVDADTGHDEYATYVNSTLANGIALVPQYANATKNRAALDAYRALGFRAVGVDCRLIIQYGGANHCISMQVPTGR